MTRDAPADDTDIFSLTDIKRLEMERHPKYRRQNCATVMGLQWDLMGSQFMAPGQDFSRKRLGLLYGRAADGWSRPVL